MTYFEKLSQLTCCNLWLVGRLAGWLSGQNQKEEEEEIVVLLLLLPSPKLYIVSTS